MANTFLALPAPAANGSGAAVDVSAMGAAKTIVVEGNGSTLYEPYVLIEISNDNASLIWTPLTQLNRPGTITVDVACRFMRATVKNYKQGGAPTVNVGGTDGGTSFAELIAPAGNGNGASVDVTALGGCKTVQVSGTFKGACNVEISNDAGATWSQVAGMSFSSGGGINTQVLYAQYLRVSRSGIQAREPNPGMPIVDIGGGTLGAALSLAVQDSPATPSSGVDIFATDVGGRKMLGVVGPDGQPTALQPFLGQRSYGTWRPLASSSNPVADNMAGITLTGTATARPPAATNFCTSLRRLGMVSAAAAGSLTQLTPSATVLQFWRGNAAGLGGFHAIFRFAVSDPVLVATANMFVGFKTSAPTDAAPSTFTNLIGVGCNSGDTTLQLYAAGAVAQARVDLGVNFPVNTVSVDVYELALFAKPNADRVSYAVRRLNVLAQAPASGEISLPARLPAAAQFLGPYFSRSNGGTAAAVAFDFLGCYVETQE